MRVTCRLDGKAHLLPHPDDIVVLRLQLFQEVEGFVTEHLFTPMPSYGKEHGDGSVDHQQIERAVGEMFFVLVAGRAEGIVRLPIRSDMRTQQRLQFFDGLTFDELTQSCLPLVMEVSQLGDADMWEVLRTESEETPQFIIHRFHRELMGQIEIFITQFGKIALVECRLLIVVGYRLQFQESGLSHEDSLYLKEIVAVVRHSIQRDAACPPTVRRPHH